VEPIATKDIALAVLGGSAAIASILLVFVGFVMTKESGLSNTATDSMVRRLTLTAQAGLLPLIAQVVVMLSCYAWLFKPSSTVLFYIWSIGFVVGVVLFLAYSIFVTTRI
jgi:hypothetical protein